jgi:hypothetical protein
VNPENSSRSTLKLAIFLKPQMLAVLEDFTLLVRCGATQNS